MNIFDYIVISKILDNKKRRNNPPPPGCYYALILFFIIVAIIESIMKQIYNWSPLLTAGERPPIIFSNYLLDLEHPMMICRPSRHYALWTFSHLWAWLRIRKIHPRTRIIQTRHLKIGHVRRFNKSLSCLIKARSASPPEWWWAHRNPSFWVYPP